MTNRTGLSVGVRSAASTSLVDEGPKLVSTTTTPSLSMMKRLLALGRKALIIRAVTVWRRSSVLCQAVGGLSQAVGGPSGVVVRPSADCVRPSADRLASHNGPSVNVGRPLMRLSSLDRIATYQVSPPGDGWDGSIGIEKM